ncbi:MAG: nucleoside deaminase [Bacteroidales bacterium]|nr:nucleoside deaminase [Bacteroidales bacterium]
MELFSDEYFMREALKEAQKAFDKEEVPVGAVIVSQKTVIARAHNLTEALNDVTAHAEMQAYTAAANLLGGKYLKDCTLYVTLEPCVMCAGAAAWTQIPHIVYGASDPKKGFSTLNASVLHPKTSVVKGVLEKECSQLLNVFFQKRRK